MKMTIVRRFVQYFECVEEPFVLVLLNMLRLMVLGRPRYTWRSGLL
jgi:hypothetical protein